MPTYPMERWRDLNPHTTDAELRTLQRYAVEHDAATGAYAGGYGLYWLGRAIEAAYAAKHGVVAVQYVHAILRSWRKRTTADTSAYGTDAPNYRPHQHNSSRRLPPIAPSISAPAALPADLLELWQRILQCMQQQVAASAFDTWLRDSVLLHLDDITAVVGVANTFVRERVTQDYAADLATALMVEFGRPIAVEVVIDGN